MVVVAYITTLEFPFILRSRSSLLDSCETNFNLWSNEWTWEEREGEGEGERETNKQINKLDFKIHDMYIRIEIFGLYAYKNISDVLVPHIVLKFFG